MVFTYRSSRGTEKVIPPDIVRQVRNHLVKTLKWNSGLSFGELNDALLAFRTETGERLLINQLEPFFHYISTRVHLWPEE